MAMKVCKECGTEISKSARVCPKCGKKQSVSGCLVAIIAVVLLVIIVAVSGGGNSSNNTEKKEKFTLQEGYTGYADSYGMAYYIEGNIVNNTDKNYSYVQVQFNLYDAGGAQIGSAMDNINNLEPNGTWKFKAVGSLGDGKAVASYKLVEITGW